MPLFLALLASTAMATAMPEVPLHVRPHPADRQARQFELELDSAAPVRLDCEEQGGGRERHRLFSPAARRHDLTLRGLKASTRYSCRATTGSDRPTTRHAGRATDDPAGRASSPVSFTTDALPEDLRAPAITVPSSDLAATGYTLYNYGVMTGPERFPGSNYLVILDAEGNVRWYYEGPGGGSVDASWIDDSRILFGGQNGVEESGEGIHIPPTIIDLDKRVEFQADDLKASRQEVPGSYHHDAGLSEDGGSIFALTYTELEEESGFTWTGFIIKEIDVRSGKLVWSWDATTDGADDLPEVAPLDADPYHANTVWDQWEDGRLYVYLSLKHLHAVYKIDYATRQVVWRLGIDGDFSLLEPDGAPAGDDRWFFEQHDVKLYGDRMFIHDNGISREAYGAPSYSRALELVIDEARGEARIVSEYTEPYWEEPVWGGYDLLDDGNTLVAMGHYWMLVDREDRDHNSALVELDPAGKVVWRADFRSRYEVLYRADRIPGCAAFANLTYCPPAG